MSYKTKIIIALLFISFGLIAQLKSQNDSLFSYVISGKILDAATKLPIEGLNVAYGSDVSSFTDSTGVFNLSVPNGNVVLTISGMGYQTQLAPVKEQQSVEVYMHEQNYPSAQQLYKDYYTVQSIAYTNKSVSTISNNTDSWKNPGISLDDLIGKNLNGLNVISRSGMLGVGSNMYLHGFSSLYGSNQPLIVIDGFIQDNPDASYTPVTNYISNPLSFIDLNDIENISLIKDAASLYGAQSGNGVLMVTTRRSKDFATKIDFNAVTGRYFSPKQLPVLEADEYRTYLTEILQSKGLTGDSISSLIFMDDNTENLDYYRYHNNTNWQDVIFTDGNFQKYNLRISGGDNIALYTLSVGYTDHTGILKNTGFNRYNARFNADINVSPKFSINSGISFAYNQYSLKEEGLVKTSPIHQSLFKSPFLYSHVKGSFGVASPILEDADILGISNPQSITDILDASSDNYQIFGVFNGNYKITKDIILSDQVSINYNKARNNLFVPHLGISADTVEQGIAENKMAHQVTSLFNLSNDLRISYSHSLNYTHNISALLGMRTRVLQVQDDWAQSNNSPNDELKTINYGTNIFRSVGGNLSDVNRLTYYLNGNYNYAGKYFISANAVVDGASNFGQEAEGISMQGAKFGVFPSAALAWLISSEKFMAPVSIVDLLKLRASYGIAGNSDLNDYPAVKYYVSQNYLGSEGLLLGSLWNPALQWEKVVKTNLGADIGILKNRVILYFDYYVNTTRDMLNVIEAMPESGFSYYVSNDGSFESSGYDISMFIRPVDTRNFKWDLNVAFSKYKTEILEFPENRKVSTIADANILSEVGGPLGVFYGYKTNGVYTTKAEADGEGLMAVLPNTELVPFQAGDIRFVDVDGNKIIDENDMQVIGDPNPDFSGMINNKLSWKGLSLEATFTVCYGKDVFNNLRYHLESMKNANNQSKAVLNRWKTEGQITDMPKVSADDPRGNARFSDRWIEDGSYARLKYLTLSYNVPFVLKYIRGLEVFVTGENLVTFTNYLGYDPEFSISEFSLAQGIDIGLTPKSKSVYAGIKVNF